jgi:hypothetical protein
MKNAIALLIIGLSFSIVLQAQTELTAEYGPPAEASVWEKFTIPLTAETFGVEQSEFEAAMANITSFWIRTEMHTGSDVGGIDDVAVGGELISNFDFSYEGWSSGGDGTMEWVQDGGVEGGFLQISDWATGDWHWLIAPASWSGDWSAYIGQDIEFWYQTNRPSYAAVIKLTTAPINRLVINAPTGNFVPPNDSVMVQLEVTPQAEEDMIVTFTTSNNSCITVPSSATIPAGESSVELYFTAAEGATEGCTSVIEASYPGYITSRITMKAEDHSSVPDDVYPMELRVFPNPSSGIIIVSEESGININRIIVYDLLGNAVKDIQTGHNPVSVDLSTEPRGMYFIRIKAGDKITTSKILLE